MKYVWIALGVLGALLVILLLALLFGRAKIRIAASATKVKVMISICGFRIWILPLKKGILKNGKDSRIARKMQEKSKRKKEEKQKKIVAGEPIPNLLDNLQLVFSLLKTVQAKLKDKFTIRVRKFRVEVASPDAAQTAILYGAVVGACSLFWEWIQASMAVVQRKRGAMQVIPNYLKTQSSAEIDVVLNMHGLKALFTVFSIMDAYKKEFQKAELKAAARMDGNKG